MKYSDTHFKVTYKAGDISKRPSLNTMDYYQPHLHISVINFLGEAFIYAFIYTHTHYIYIYRLSRFMLVDKNQLVYPEISGIPHVGNEYE